jgi:hypothetical protein
MARCTRRGSSQRQAATVREGPRSTLQAWRGSHDRRDACPAVVAFVQSGPGLAFLPQLVMALHLVCVEIGACGRRLVCLFLKLTGLHRWVGASYGTQPQVNRPMAEALVPDRQADSTRLAQEMPPQERTMTLDETLTGGLGLVGMAPESPYMVLEHTAPARAQDMWHAWMAPALAGLPCKDIYMKLSVDSLDQSAGFVLFCQTLAEYLGRSVSFA